jgi:hypothetical protein
MAEKTLTEFLTILVYWHSDMPRFLKPWNRKMSEIIRPEEGWRVVASCQSMINWQCLANTRPIWFASSDGVEVEDDDENDCITDDDSEDEDDSDNDDDGDD